jgi:hypothetical protein
MSLRIHAFFLVTLIFIAACSSVEKKYSENSDLYWSALVKSSEKKKMSILEVLKKENPHLAAQVDADAADAKSLLGFWGKSLNFDAGAKKQIISDAIITDLHKKFHYDLNSGNDTRIVHAGITHTYGYLFSVLDTPYGYKRKRWIEPTLNYAFTFSGNSLSPETMQGTLLSNVTYFAGKIAFKETADKARLEHLKNVSSEVKNFDYSKLDKKILEEEINHHPITLRTTLVKLPFKTREEENDYLLIYSVLNSEKETLITAFPIKKDAFNKIVDSDGLGKNQPIATRYNAYIEGIMDQKLTGTRKLH